MEMEIYERESMKQLKDVFHDHHQPLVFNKEQSKFSRCSACKNPLSGESYNCAECDEFHLHKTCAEAPLQINHLHRKHGHLTLQSNINEKEYDNCLLCDKTDNKFGYCCSSCREFIHIECALLTLEHGHEILHDCHEHPLLLIENHNTEFKGNVCNFCDCPLLGSIYVCSTCTFLVHKNCTEILPVEISHPCHRSALFLNKNEEREHYKCEACDEIRWGSFYSCSFFSCNFRIDFRCIWPRLVVEDKSHHEHPFNLLWKRDPFVCNACGEEGKYVSYVCLQCHLQVHHDCTSLPRYIKSLFHRHPLSHKYFLESMEHQKLDCRVCRDEVKTEHGSYSCLKQDCDYVVHVKCAIIKDTQLYEVIDPNEIEGLLEDKPGESCITCVIERNESGEALKIKHLFHEHELMLIKEEDIDHDHVHKQCDGCTGSISTSFYYCSRYPQCNFLLHKSCAELPRTWDGWLLSYPFTLEPASIFKCDPCGQQCSGFFYKYYEEEYSLVLCLRCAKISDTFEYPGHQHFLFYNIQNEKEWEWEGKCTACGSEGRSARPFYTCKHDDVALDYQCMTLPHATRHKCDKHLLQLTYRDQSDDPIQHDCDICEEGRDPNHWFYHCSICDNSAHPRCVLGEYPLIKIGSMYEDKDHHPHPLTFVQKIYYYPKCAECGEHFLDLSLECTSCNYIVHWKCISPHFED
ncbi:Zinc finger, PHD-type [Corchorus olitorius]|uniref:Zinc finger, PHD-type n=1 Tax=Corchorus olitorius TaxID=93759 RepID=A0A1R3GXS6_9ROSI|nr:Zinc finger, PHD-type [Corchorus olitorius]